jgi:hypothetical protein
VDLADAVSVPPASARASARVARVAPYALLRVGALPLDALADLAPPRTRAALRVAIESTRDMEAAREAAEAALHDLVPRLLGRSRGAVLELKRAVHNGRRPSPSVTARALAAVAEHTDAGGIHAWLSASDSLEAARAELDRLLPIELDAHLRPGLARLASEERFRQPLAVASGSLAERLQAEPPVGASSGGSTKYERAIWTYLMRAAAKTSPFSTFMFTQLLEAGGDAGGAPRASEGAARRGSVAYVNRALVGAAQEVLRGSDHSHDRLLRPNPTIRCDAEGSVTAIVPRLIVFGGRTWRGERRNRFRLHARVVEVLTRLPAEVRMDDVLAALEAAGVESAAAGSLAEKLASSGLLLEQPRWDAYERAPEVAFLEALRGRGSDGLSGEFARIAAGQRIARELPSADARARVTLLRDVAPEAVEYGGTDGASVEASLRSVAVVMEDGVVTEPGAIPRGALSVLDDVARVLSERVRVSAAHRSLRRLFDQRYGQAGTCRDVLPFLEEAASTLTWADAVNDDPGDDGPPARVAAPATALVQLLGSGDGSSRAVVNGVYSGCGALAARYTHVPHLGGRLRDHLASWLRSVSGEAEPVDVPICGDCNSLQAHAPVTARALRWVTEPVLGLEALEVRDVVLRRHPATQLLELVDRDGRPIRPVYLGGTLPTPLWGPRYWLIVIGQPFAVPLPGEDANVSCEAVQFTERFATSGVVLRRATWRMASELMRSEWFASRGAERLLAVALGRRRHRIPRFVFARSITGKAPSVISDSHKPVWVDTENPISLEVLEALVRGAPTVVLTEALPAPTTAWAPPGNEGFASELLIDLAL